MADKKSEALTEEKPLVRKEAGALSPFRIIERFADEMDRVFDDFGFGRGFFASRPGFGLVRPLVTRTETWLPDIEMVQRKDDLVVRAELPGLTKDDVKIDITENAIIIQGERKREVEEEKGGVYRCERSYGSFYRELPLPEGAMTDQAKAVFKDGVLEVTMPAPPAWVKQGRRLEITEPILPKQ